MKQKFINWTMTSCSASQSTKKDYEWIKRRNTGVVLAKDSPIIKLETGEEIDLLRSIRELKWLVVVGIRLCTFSFHTVLVLQPSYLFLQWTFGVCHKYFTFTVFSGYSSLRISMLFLNCHLHSMAFMTSSIYFVDDCYHRTPLVRWSLNQYKCLCSVEGKGRDSSF